VVIDDAVHRTVIGLQPLACVPSNIAMTDEKPTDTLGRTELHICGPLSYELDQGEKLRLDHHLQDTFMTIIIHA
jgi:hypothetical protein